tara:strand:- start:7795 stop:9411 length:1617 start_codon:yes stop_codon:yes gene_type:complete
MASSIYGHTIQPIKTVLPIKKGPAIEEVPKINNLEPKKSFEPKKINSVISPSTDIENVISPSEIQAQERVDYALAVELTNEELASIENKKSLQEIQAQERADYDLAVELMNEELANIYGGYDNIPEFNKDAFNEDNQDLKKNLKGNSADPFEQNEIQAILFTTVILDSPVIDNSVLPEPVQKIVSKKLGDVKVNVASLDNYSQFTQEVNEYANNRLNRHQVREFSISTVKASGLAVKSPPEAEPGLEGSRSVKKDTLLSLGNKYPNCLSESTTGSWLTHNDIELKIKTKKTDVPAVDQFGENIAMMPALDDNKNYSHIAETISIKQLEMIKQLLATIFRSGTNSGSSEYVTAVELLKQDRLLSEGFDLEKDFSDLESLQGAFRTVFGEENLKYFEFIFSNNKSGQISNIFDQKYQLDESRIHIQHFFINTGAKDRSDQGSNEGNHWVYCAIQYDQDNPLNYDIFYKDSFGYPPPERLFAPSSNGKINLYENEEVQQYDGHSCGYWALENYYHTCTSLEQGKPLSELATGSSVLSRLYS